jgi:hypothetical protein
LSGKSSVLKAPYGNVGIVTLKTAPSARLLSFLSSVLEELARPLAER